MAKEKTLNIEIPYTPRPLQKELHELIDKNRFNVVSCHRRLSEALLLDHTGHVVQRD